MIFEHCPECGCCFSDKCENCGYTKQSIDTHDKDCHCKDCIAKSVYDRSY